MGLRYQNNVEMLQKLDLGDYNEAEMVTVKIPISVPYASESEEFERVDGLFEHKGEFYRLVKQRLFQDTLQVVCVKDQELAYINQAWTSYVKTFTDNHSDNQSQSTISYSFIKDYLTRSFSIIQFSPGWVCDVVKQTNINIFISDFYPSIIHPPEGHIS